LFVVQKLILKVNQQYIASAAQADRYRTEPAFKLQGSYRNMNKMAEKISSVMNEDELMQLIEDHYLGESQLLTNGTEENLLKLAELRGNMTPEQAARWEQIKTDFMRTKALGGDETDSGNKIANQMINLVEGLSDLESSIIKTSETNTEQLSEQNAEQTKLAKIELKKEAEQAQQILDALNAISTALGTQDAPQPIIEIINQPSDKIIALERIHELKKSVESIKVKASQTTRTRKKKSTKEDPKLSSDSKRF